MCGQLLQVWSVATYKPEGNGCGQDFKTQEGVGSLSLLHGIFPTQGSNPGLPTLQVDSLPVESPGKPKNTRVGNLSFLQGFFWTQQSNWDLLQCRWILYQLSYQGSPSSG